jgi:hypothetical protein
MKPLRKSIVKMYNRPRYMYIVAAYDGTNIQGMNAYANSNHQQWSRFRLRRMSFVPYRNTLAACIASEANRARCPGVVQGGNKVTTIVNKIFHKAVLDPCSPL